MNLRINDLFDGYSVKQNDMFSFDSQHCRAFWQNIDMPL